MAPVQKKGTWPCITIYSWTTTYSYTVTNRPGHCAKGQEGRSQGLGNGHDKDPDEDSLSLA